MEPIYLITGANGHLGGTLVRLLRERGAAMRGLVLPGESYQNHEDITYYEGDVRDPESLAPFFSGLEGREVYLIHTAGLIDIADQVSPRLYDVNVNGTRNVLALCRAHGVKRLLYVSSVHAIPENGAYGVMAEVGRFCPERVQGGYAKTKAEATQAVLEAAREGLNAVVVHPSGILGPYDESGNHLVQLVQNTLTGKLPAGVQGGYDLVDVRDVAEGCLSALEKGKRGECYILSNRHYDIRTLLGMIHVLAGTRRVPTLPVWLARLFAPLFTWWARLRHKRPLYTKYSLYTIVSNDRYSHDKATEELGYRPRDLCETLRDTIVWLKYRRLEPVG